MRHGLAQPRVAATDYVGKGELEFLIHLPPIPETVGPKWITTTSLRVLWSTVSEARASYRLGNILPTKKIPHVCFPLTAVKSRGVKCSPGEDMSL